MGVEKYSKQEKLAAVKYVLEEGHSIAQTAKAFGISKNPIEKWVNAYKIHGEKGLDSRNLIGRQRGFEDAFRLRVIRYKEEQGSSCTQTAAYFMLDVATVSKWWKKYQEEGIEGLVEMRNPKTQEEGAS